MRVLLVQPVPPRTHWPVGVYRSYFVPTGLAYLATSLRDAGHDVRIVVREQQIVSRGMDRDAADADLRAILEQFRPQMLGLSLMTPFIAEARSIAAAARQVCGPELLVVAGGVHPTALPEQTLRDCPEFDAAVLGEAEQTIVELANGGADAPVAGAAIRRGHDIAVSPPRQPTCDLDSLGEPALDLLDMGYFTARNRWTIRHLPLKSINIRTSRGCTNRCRFCAGHLVGGVGVRFHSLDHVMRQIDRAVRQWGVEAVHFEDDTLGADRARLLELAGRIGSTYGGELKWECCLRVDQADADLLVAMKKSGCIQIEYGFESGSDQTLRRLGKNATAELNRRAVRLTKEAGLRIFADIMVGLPGETMREFKATIAFLRKSRPEIISASRLHPLPGTPIFNQLPPEMRGKLDWADYTYLDLPEFELNLTVMPLDRFRQEYRKFRRYLIGPQFAWAMLRDSSSDDAQLRRQLRRKLRRFVLRHPIRAARLPW